MIRLVLPASRNGCCVRRRDALRPVQAGPARPRR